LNGGLYARRFSFALSAPTHFCSGIRTAPCTPRWRSYLSRVTREACGLARGVQRVRGTMKRMRRVLYE